MSNRNDKFRLTVNPLAAASVHDDGIVIMHVGNGRMFTANEAGARIWRGVELQLPLEVIVEEISAAYQIDRTEARQDAVHFLAEMERHALIERRAES